VNIADGEAAAASKMFAGDDQRTICLAAELAIICIPTTILYIAFILRLISAPPSTYR